MHLNPAKLSLQRTSLMAPFIRLYASFLLLLILFDITLSQFIIETLPGFPRKLPFRLETGYIDVGESENVHLFYYFIESENNPVDDPLMLWLAGGPGCSGLSALLFEIGPLTINYTGSTGKVPALRLNPYSWTKAANIIFLDQPVGTGFSYGETWEAYLSSDSLSVLLTHEFLRKWFLSHPRFRTNPLYIGGDSYSGIIIPPLVQEIYNGNEVQTESSLNIKGYIQGNPITDKFIDYNSRVTFAHRMALLSDNLYQSTKSNCEGNFLYPEPENLPCLDDLQRVAECLEKIYTSNILEPWCGSSTEERNPLTLDPSSADLNPKDILTPAPQSWCRDDNYLPSITWANDKIVQEELRVRQGSIAEWTRCNTSIEYDGTEGTESYIFDVPSTIETHRNLSHRHTRALVYSGDHDMIVPHVATEEWINSLGLKVKSEWRPWFFNGQIAGYTESYSHNSYDLTYATVKGGGHTAPEYKPKQCLAMITRWLRGYDL